MANKGIIEQIRQRESSSFGDRLNLVISEASYRAASIVPTRYRWIVPGILENIALPIPEFPEVKQEILQTLAGETVEEEITHEPVEVIPVKPLYPAYRCLRSNPLHCEWPEKTVLHNPDAVACQQCGFPALLPPEARILGIRGTYQIEGYFRSRNL
ncbi:MAG: hypothetical protein F6K03_14325, partial [Kamptonema sp. SIO4C4]|nr:hypothetical protein [Kamptonema sp. SIO4C4]